MEKCVNKQTVQRLLIHLGVAPKTNGYGYLTSAIAIQLQSRPRSKSMRKLCEEVALENRVTPSSVERCMRFSVARAYNATRLAGINEIYNADIINEVPMLSDFITYIVEYFDTFYRYDDFFMARS